MRRTVLVLLALVLGACRDTSAPGRRTVYAPSANQPQDLGQLSELERAQLLRKAILRRRAELERERNVQQWRIDAGEGQMMERRDGDQVLATWRSGGADKPLAILPTYSPSSGKTSGPAVRSSGGGGVAGAKAQQQPQGRDCGRWPGPFQWDQTLQNRQGYGSQCRAANGQAAYPECCGGRR